MNTEYLANNVRTRTSPDDGFIRWGHLQTDQHGKVLSASQRVQLILGLPQENLLGHILWELPLKWHSAEEKGPGSAAYLHRLLKNYREGFEGEMLLGVENGFGKNMVAMLAAPLYEADGCFGGWLLHLRRENPISQSRMELRARRQQQSGLMKLSMLKLEALSTACDDICDTVLKYLHAHRVSIWLVEEDKKKIVCHASQGQDHERILQKALTRDQCPVYFDHLFTQTTLDIEDSLNDERSRELRDIYLIPEGVRAMLDMPIRRDGQLNGVLCVEQTDQPRQWHLSEKQFTATAASYVALALNHQQKVFAQQQAQRRARDLHVTLQAISDAVVVTDAQGNIRNLNPAAEKMAGLTCKIAGGKPAKDHVKLYDAQSQAHQTLPLEQALRNRETVSLNHTLYLCNQNQEVSYVNVNASPIVHDDGSLYGGVMVCRDVSKSHKMRRRLEKSEAHYRSIFELAPIGILHFNGQGVVTQLNKRLEEYLGLRQDELMGKNLFKIIQDQDLLSALQVAYQEGQTTYEGEYQSVLSGKVLYTRGYVRTHRNDEGQVDWGIMIVEDITNRVLMEQRLRESEAHYRSLVNSIPGAVFLSHFDARLSSIYVSSRIESISGHSKNQFFQQEVHLMDLLYRNDRPEVTAKLQEAHDNDDNFRIMARMRHRHSSDPVWVEIIGKVSTREENMPMVEGVIFDVSDLKKAERRLHESERMIASINRNINEGIYRSSPSKGLIYVNQAFLNLFGYQSLEEIRSVFAKSLYLNPQTRDRVADELMEEGYLENQEVLLKRKDGTPFWAALNATMTVEADGTIYFDGAIRDITLDKEALREIKVARHSAVEMNRLKSTFLANMSHELRTPLNGIIGLSDLQRKDEQIPSRYLTYAEMIFSSGNRLLNAVNDIMDFSKAESGKLHIEPKRLNLTPAIQEVVELQQVVARKKNIDLRVNAPDNLHIMGDALRLNQILNNLIGNALKFTEEGYVAVEAYEHEDKAIVEVRDSGPGIDHAFQQIIFNPFEQTSKGYQRSHEGTGLGLAITKELVELHQGQIELRSIPGEGTTFVIHIPLETHPSA